MASYPDTFPSWVDKINLEDIVEAAHVNKLQDELDAALRELDTNPKGSFTHVRARLENIESTKSDGTHTHDAAYVSDAGGAVSFQGDTRANQPAAGTVGRFYFVTDELVLERDNGTSWDVLVDLSHRNDSTNPHSVTTSQIGAATDTHDHGSTYAPTPHDNNDHSIRFADAEGDNYKNNHDFISANIQLGAFDETGLNVYGLDNPTLDITKRTTFLLDLNADTTLTFEPLDTNLASRSFTLIVRQDNTGGRTITWPSSVIWPGGSVPVLSSGANEIDVFTFMTSHLDSNTSRWYGFVVGQDMA